MSRTLLKIEDEVIEVAGEDELEARSLSQEEQFEAVVLDNDFNKMFANDLNKIAEQSYSELLNTLKNDIKGTVLKCLGFEKNSWGDEWRVDHCNNRMSVVSEHISEHVKKTVKSEIDDFMLKEAPKVLKEARKVLAKEFKERYLREVRYQASQEASIAAKIFLKEMMESEVKRFSKEAATNAKAKLLGRKVKSSDSYNDEDEDSTS